MVPAHSLLRNLRRAHHRGATILILENVARRPVPWWDDWADSFKQLGGREDTWQFCPHLPEKLALLDKASGRDHSVLKARTLFLPTKGQPMNPAIKQILSINQDFYTAFSSANLVKMRAVWADTEEVVCIHPGWSP